VIDESIHDTAGVAEWDPLKLSIDVSGLSTTGYQAKEWLLSKRQIAAQLGDAHQVVCSHVTWQRMLGPSQWIPGAQQEW
jgi:hypothetical protein